MSTSEAPDFQVRGYMILSVVTYLRETQGEEGRRAVENLSPATRKVIATATSAAYHPIAALSEAYDAVAGLGNGDEKRAQELIINCGAYVAREATNTFLKLLMKMLTPTLFAKKLPDFWRRDCTRGRLEVDVTDQKLVCRFYDSQGFNHTACCGAGFARFALETMGKSIEEVNLLDWSLATPYQEGTGMELIWKN